MLRKWAFVMALATLFTVLSVFVGLVKSQADEPPPLTSPGPYGVRVIKMTLVDENREDWTTKVRIWYPADKTKEIPASPSNPILKEAPPDRSGAPYPLIVDSHGWTGNSLNLSWTKAHLASYGYVVAAPQHHDTVPPMHEFVDRPLDVLLVIDSLADITEGDLVGMIDTNNVGLMGYSSGGDTVMQMLGLLSDPSHYVNWCAEHPGLATPECTNTSVPLEETIAYRAQLGLENTADGRWMPFSDERIRAVLALAPGDFPLTSEDILATVTTPTMILHGTRDQFCDYEGNAVRTYTHLGTEDRYLITLVDGYHETLMGHEPVIQHFATAFFGRYLEGDTTYAPYLTPEGLPAWESPRIAWGPYEGD